MRRSSGIRSMDTEDDIPYLLQYGVHSDSRKYRSAVEVEPFKTRTPCIIVKVSARLFGVIIVAVPVSGLDKIPFCPVVIVRRAISTLRNLRLWQALRRAKIKRALLEHPHL